LSEPSTLLFDLDGTLLHTLPDIRATLNHVRQTLSLPGLDDASVRACVGGSLELLLERAMSDQPEGSTPPVSELVPVYQAYNAIHIVDASHLYDGVEHGLEHLKALGHPMAMVTNKPTAPTAVVVSHFGLDRFFEVVICGDTMPHSKPHPEPVLEACRRLDRAPNTTIMIGDSPSDLIAGRKAGCQQALGVTWGYRSAAQLAQCPNDGLFDSFSGVVAYVSR